MTFAQELLRGMSLSRTGSKHRMHIVISSSIDVQGRLEHAISYEPIAGWKSTEDVECYIDVDMGDYVVYNDWVGQVRFLMLACLMLLMKDFPRLWR